MGLKDLSAIDFVSALSSKEPTPGGGSAAGLVGAIGVGLLLMVANYIEDQTKVAPVFEPFNIAKNELLELIDLDADSFNLYMKAIKLPKATDEEKKERSKEMQAALVNASQIPFATMKACVRVIPYMNILEQECKKGMISDLGASATCLRSAIESAYLNIIINAGSIKDKEYADKLLAESIQIKEEAINSLNTTYQNVVKILVTPNP
jgi:formiminotetrahydrofolate cyclodeaminase